jgi:GDPmannose 4,6-dehydratase
MSEQPLAIITGSTGQDGAYLTRFLLEKGYRVVGTYRRTSSSNFWRLQELGIAEHESLSLVENDLQELSSCIRLLEKYPPLEVYNLAAQSFVGVSFDQPILTGQITGLGAVNVLESIRTVNPGIRFYQASTSEMFGKVRETPQSEATPFYPRSPYGAAKLYAHWMTINYRESHGIFGASGILFNHESPLRGLEFVTRKITDAVARITLKKQEALSLGNLDARRDWGFAGDYVEGMWKMLQHATPETFVLGTGRTESVRTFVEMSFRTVDVKLEWEGQNDAEVGRDAVSGRTLVTINPRYYRPAEVDYLQADATLARTELGWSTPTTLEALCDMMVHADLKRVEHGRSF